MNKGTATAQGAWEAEWRDAHVQFGGAISIGIDQFNPAGAASCNGSTTAVPAQVQISGSEITNNVASDSGGGIYMLSGALGLTVSPRPASVPRAGAPF